MTRDTTEMPRASLIREADFPEFQAPSSQARRDTQPVKAKRTVKGHIREKKLNFIERFLGDDLQSVASYVLKDVILPAGKSMLLDALEMAFFGEIRGKRVNRNSSAPWYTQVDYTGYSRGRSSSSTPRTSNRKEGSVRTIGDVTFETKWDAEQAVENLADVMADAGEVSVADFFEAACLPSRHTDYKYGWRDLSDVRVVKNRDGSWSIKMPREEVL